MSCFVEGLYLAVCSSLVEFLSLANFPSLEDFQLEGAGKLKAIHGFAKLIALRVLSLEGGKKLEELPGIEACTRLSWLDLCGTSIGDCSWISAMEDMTFINLNGTKIRFVPNCSNLYKLSQFWLDDCQALESIGVNTGSIPATFQQSLQRFSARKCRSLNAVPQFHHKSTLYYLDLKRTSVDNVSSVIYCQLLQKLFFAETQITILPDLSSLTRLEVLDVHGCKLLTRMDNIKSLPSLDKLYVFGCTSLLALPDLGSSTRLKALSLRGCPLVDPNLVKLPSTIEMEIEDATDIQLYKDDDAQECESQTVSTAIDFQELEPTHDLWRPTTLLNLVALGSVLVWWLGRN